MKPWIIAHRGASASAPENTIAALQAAVAAGARAAEVDVQSTRDGVLVLVHDDTWQRTTGLAAPIAATPWDVVRGLDAGSWFGNAFRGTPVPTLDDLCDFVSTQVGFELNLEIKSPEHHHDLGPRVLAALRRRGFLDRVVCTSFDAGVIEALAEAEPRLRCGYLSGEPVVRRHPRVRLYAIAAAALLRAPEWMRQVRAQGGAVWAWTVDDPRIAARLTIAGVEAIITNRPELYR